jgi:hypothetical protein
VDERLRSRRGLRLERLTAEDLPELARAIVGVVRKTVTISTGQEKDRAFVRLTGPGVNAIVRGEDWQQILPYFLDGTLDPIRVPVSPVYSLDPFFQNEVALVPIRDQDLYRRTLAVLSGLFTTSFPRSNL